MANNEQTQMRNRLRKWLDSNGKKWPNDDLASIENHIALRDEYISRYGIKTIGHLMGQWNMLYEEVKRNCDRAIRHKAEDERWAMEAREREERANAADKRIAAEIERDAKRDADRVLKDARDNIERNEGMLRVSQEHVQQLADKITWVESRIEQLSDEFLEEQKGSSMYYPLRKRRRHWDARLPSIRKDLANAKRKVRDYKARIAESYDILGEKPAKVNLDAMAVIEPKEEPKREEKWENRHPFYHLIGPSNSNRVIVVDKPDDRRYKRFEKNKLVEQRSLTDAEFEAFDVRG